MTLSDLEVLMPEEAAFKRAFRKDEVLALLKGSFSPGRVSYVHVTKFPNGSELRLKFYNVIKPVLNSKGKEVLGKESWLSYVEVAVYPAGKKPYMFTQDISQHVWGTSKTKATAKHEESLAALRAQGEALGIDLSPSGAWCSTFNQNY